MNSVRTRLCTYAGLKNAPTVLWQTSNGGWALLALALYLAFPYDLSPGSPASLGPLTYAFFASRYPIWLTMAGVFYGFWHVTLYGLGFARRPFVTVGDASCASLACGTDG